MLFFNYFTEIRNRVLFIAICWISVFIVSYYYKEILLFLLVKLSVKEAELAYFYFIATSLTDIFNTYLEMSYFISFQVSLIIIIYNLLSFLSPGLFMYEYKKIIYFIKTFFVFTLLGLYVLNFQVIEYLFKFFLSFNESSSTNLEVFFEFKITEYLQFYKSIYYTAILLSQFFVLIFLFIDHTPNKTKFVLTTRKFFYLTFLLVSTMATPPDVLSQLMTTFSLIAYFEFLVVYVIIRNLRYKNFKIIITYTTKNNVNS